MKQHPLSSAFPSLSDAEFAALTRDVEANGVRNPITTLDGEVIDGWHRYRACIELGIEPPMVELSETVDPAAFVLSLNLNRRHLSASQRAAAVALVTRWRENGQTSSAPGAELPPTTENLASIADVSPRTMAAAKAAVRAGRGEEVRDGKISAKAAEAETKPKTARAVEPSEPEDDASARIDDLAMELEALGAVVAADDKLKAATDALMLEKRAHAQTRAMFDAKCQQLADMTREAKRWRRRAEAAEKAVPK